MDRKRKILAIAACALIVLGALVYFYRPGGVESKPVDVGEAEFSEAKVVFPIDNVSRAGNTVSFTITENARELDEKADSVEISAMKKVTAGTPEKCPLVKSTSIDRSIENYNPLSGSADVQAVFATAEMARTAEEADCLLIRDTE